MIKRTNIQYKCGTKVWINKKEFHLRQNSKNENYMKATIQSTNTKVGKKFLLSKIFSYICRACL